MNKSDLAPVILFVYGRPTHTRRTIDALLINPEASSTDLIIYSDGPKNNEDLVLVNQVRDIVKKVTGFKSVELIERKENLGLAQNIIDGVTAVCKKYEKIIVLEDDIVTSPSFLNFMNTSLNKYENNKNVWHISGWNYPLGDTQSLPETFFWRTMNCWGWATWSDRWKYFNKEPEKLINTWSKKDIYHFNLDGTYNFWSQVTANYNKKINTWAIFWYATIFSYNGLCLNPTQSLVYNTGNDGTGENCENNDIYKNNPYTKTIKSWPNIVKENSDIVCKIKLFYKKHRLSYMHRIFNKIKRTFI
ncbi:glycosyltransferase family protein [Providencia stuartii]|uniref:glycosyltransferase n=1 Tax=Providencia stuartii TaxID=588 RepID=UPI0024AAAECD|nr:glycosyltransferase [Providencia stuartii]MCX3070482.1 glycosyltransferase [Providencia stuartii]